MSSADVPASVAVPSSVAAAEPTFSELLLNLWGHFTPFNLPSTEEVILAVTRVVSAGR